MRNRTTKLAAGIVVLAVAALLAAPPKANEAQPPAVQDDAIVVYFSPKGGCTAAVVQALGRAKKSIDLQAYSFTSTEIAKALADAHDRGVKVRALLDKKANVTGKYSGATYIFNHGIPTFVDGKHPIAHNKIILIDGETVITGSFNFTKQAESGNAENLLVITGKRKIAAAYESNFAEHLGHAEPYTGIKDGARPDDTEPADK